MMIRKNISLKKEHMEMLRPLIRKHDGNISAAIREIIVFSKEMVDRYGSMEKALKRGPDEAESRERYIEEELGTIVPQSLVRWFLKYTRGLVPKTEIIRDLIDVGEDVSLDEWKEEINKRNKIFGFPVTIDFYHKKEMVNLRIKGRDPLFNEYEGMIVSIYLAERYRPMKIVDAEKPSTSMKIVYERCSNKEEAYKSLIEHFGYNQDFFDAICRKLDFWKGVVSASEMLNYNMVIITKEVFERLIKGEEYLGGIEFLELKTGKYFKDITPEELLRWVKGAFVDAGIVDRVEYDEEKVLVYHCFKDPIVIRKIEQWIHIILESTGSKFEVESSYGTSVYYKVKE